MAEICVPKFDIVPELEVQPCRDMMVVVVAMVVVAVVVVVGVHFGKSYPGCTRCRLVAADFHGVHKGQQHNKIPY